MVLLEHAVRVLQLVQLLEGAVRLLEGVASHHLQVLLQQLVVVVRVSFVFGPFDFEPEDAGVFGQDEPAQVREVDVFGGLHDAFIVLVPHVIPTAEELLLFVGNRDDDGSRP